MVKTVPKFNRKIVETCAKSMPPNTHNEEIYHLIEHNKVCVLFFVLFILVLLSKTALFEKK